MCTISQVEPNSTQNSRRARSRRRTPPRRLVAEGFQVADLSATPSGYAPLSRRREQQTQEIHRSFGEFRPLREREVNAKAIGARARQRLGAFHDEQSKGAGRPRKSPVRSGDSGPCRGQRNCPLVRTIPCPDRQCRSNVELADLQRTLVSTCSGNRCCSGGPTARPAIKHATARIRHTAAPTINGLPSRKAEARPRKQRNVAAIGWPWRSRSVACM
jgi:hypothetical protein